MELALASHCLSQMLGCCVFYARTTMLDRTSVERDRRIKRSVKVRVWVGNSVGNFDVVWNSDIW